MLKLKTVIQCKSQLCAPWRSLTGQQPHEHKVSKAAAPPTEIPREAHVPPELLWGAKAGPRSQLQTWSGAETFKGKI